MTQENKELLYKDICTRLPYGVIYNFGGNEGCDYKLKVICVALSWNDSSITLDNAFPIEDCKPYLRPMSSMTEEEKEEYEILTNLEYDGYLNDDRPNYTGEIVVYVDDVPELIDFYNAHHLDYRGLIPMGLAIEVTEKNNPYK